MSASIVLVGAGPRAVVVAARLVADHRVLCPELPLTVHLVDAVEVGAGRTWRTDQDRLLLNNTYTAETTVFADPTVPTVGATEPGPSLAAWAARVADDPNGWEPWVVTEARRTRPWTFPSRAFQGVYFRWALDRVINSAPDRMDFSRHLGQVVALTDGDDQQTVIMDDGERLAADLVILTQGLLTAEGAAETTIMVNAAASQGLVHLPPGMPSEHDWDRLPADEPVLVRGLGANFFDLLGLLFEGRGGRFERGAGGELHYRASGREPRVIAGSRHGLPYRAKAAYPTGLPEPVELRRLSADCETELIARHGGRADVDAATLLAELNLDLAELYAAAARREGRGPSFDLERAAFPATTRTFATESEWATFLDGHLDAELHRIRTPDDPDKIVHRAVETARRRLSRLVLAGVFTPASVLTDLKGHFWPIGLVLASGPPPDRLEQLAALHRAGLVEILGPGLTITVDATGFVAHTAIPGQQRSARVLAEARMSLGDLRSTDDPLVRSMIAQGQARYHAVTDGRGGTLPTSTLDVTADQFLLIDADGRPHPRRIVLGSPAGDIQWNAALGAVPDTSDKMLVGAERAAAYALRQLAGSQPTRS